ncbi:hypothetical protein [Urbanus proteus nucleopolyhedrovirus]|uniref:Ac81-like protein n=1 Tax=Urbanus proteus nucleopolyhedrovirus TaxID=1675866 RepID=A0A162GUU6_9ABAC|nr:hypothetical protein [Urbanus proteus nucleopolyhedrovirus]AKR17369.1 hypothetical protein [Urbanus proteus nucleopolyhedrovirus]
MTACPNQVAKPIAARRTLFQSDRLLRNKNLTTLNRIKYDPEMLLHLLFDNYQYSDNCNVIKVCKVKVKKTGGIVLAHYYAHVQLSNNFEFEFHPGSQPKTFQNVHTLGNVLIVNILCDACVKRELYDYILGENKFNVAFYNCERILCKRQSVQTVFITVALIIIGFNMFSFSWLFIFLTIIIIMCLYVINNYMISGPLINYCIHKSQKHNNEQ